MQRKKVITAHNFVKQGFACEKPSLTIPGQILPVRTVLDRFRRGQSVQSFTPVYNPDIPPGIEYLSKIERIEAAREQAATVARMRQALANQHKRDKAAATSVQSSQSPTDPQQ